MINKMTERFEMVPSQYPLEDTSSKNPTPQQPITPLLDNANGSSTLPSTNHSGQEDSVQDQTASNPAVRSNTFITLPSTLHP